MHSLLEIQFEVESFMCGHVGNNRNFLWDRLLKSSVKFDGTGCDGIILSEVEKYTEKLLSKIIDKEMFEIWEETENGIMAVEQGFNEPYRLKMIHDISLDVIQAIVEDICFEASNILKEKKRKRKA